jgi:hypothetical protein
VEQLGAGQVISTEQRGVLLERRIRLPSGLELDAAFGPLSWASTDPLDEGTVQVASRGLVPLHDPDGLLQRLLAAVHRSS